MLKTIIDQAVSGIKEDILKNMTFNMNLMETRNNLKAQCEAEQIKVNRRPDNVKIIEVHNSLEQGKSREPIEQS